MGGRWFLLQTPFHSAVPATSKSPLCFGAVWLVEGGGGGRSQTLEAPAMATDEIRAVEEGKRKASGGLCNSTLFFSARKKGSTVVHLLPPRPPCKTVEFCCWKEP